MYDRNNCRLYNFAYVFLWLLSICLTVATLFNNYNNLILTLNTELNKLDVWLYRQTN